jgi:hypothetical protein
VASVDEGVVEVVVGLLVVLTGRGGLEVVAGRGDLVVVLAGEGRGVVLAVISQHLAIDLYHAYIIFAYNQHSK